MPDNTPVICTAVVVRDTVGCVLLLRRTVAPRAGLWHLPGGRVELGESIFACARRELHEETGLMAPIGSLEYLGVTNHEGMKGMVFRLIDASWEPTNAEPGVHDAIGWFDPDKPPEPLFAGTAEVLGWLIGGGPLR